MSEQIPTALKAIQEGDFPGLKRLIEAHPDLASAKTEQGISLLMMAAYHRQAEMVEAFLSKRTTLDVHEASALGDIATIEQFLSSNPNSVDHLASDGFAPLGLACFFGQEQVAKHLITAGADVNLAASNPFKVRPLHSAVASKQLGIAKVLLEAGADASAAQMKGVTPLHSAAHNGQVEMVKLLLAFGASKEAKMEDGRIPLDMAVEDGHEAVVKILQ